MPRERLYGSQKEAYRPLDSLDESAYSGKMPLLPRPALMHLF